MELSEFQKGLGAESENVEVDVVPIINAIKYLLNCNSKYAQLEYEF